MEQKFPKEQKLKCIKFNITFTLMDQKNSFIRYWDVWFLRNASYKCSDGVTDLISRENLR